MEFILFFRNNSKQHIPAAGVKRFKKHLFQQQIPLQQIMLL